MIASRRQARPRRPTTQRPGRVRRSPGRKHNVEARAAQTTAKTSHSQVHQAVCGRGERRANTITQYWPTSAGVPRPHGPHRRRRPSAGGPDNGVDVEPRGRPPAGPWPDRCRRVRRTRARLPASRRIGRCSQRISSMRVGAIRATSASIRTWLWPCVPDGTRPVRGTPRRFVSGHAFEVVDEDEILKKRSQRDFT
jgi:hypothetical protein